MNEIESLRQQLAEARAEVSREVDRTHQHTCRIIALENQLAAQAAELERLRERCEAVVTAYRYYRSTEAIGHSVYTKENGRNGNSPHAELFTALSELAASWLPDSNNKGDST